jgi:hypothetical protein
MPPLAASKQPNVHFQAPKDPPNPNGSGTRGPPTTGFKSVDSEILDATIMEVEASHKLRRVQAFIRDNRHQTAPFISDGVRLLRREIEEHLMMMRIRARQSGSTAGIVVPFR